MKRLAILFAVAIAGCANNREKSVLVKSTVFGLRVSPGAAAPGAPSFDLGLVRNQYVAVPRGENVVAISDADIRTTRQTASEELRFGPEATVTPPAKTNAPTAPRSVTASLTNTVKVKSK